MLPGNRWRVCFEVLGIRVLRRTKLGRMRADSGAGRRRRQGQRRRRLSPPRKLIVARGGGEPPPLLARARSLADAEGTSQKRAGMPWCCGGSSGPPPTSAPRRAPKKPKPGGDADDDLDERRLLPPDLYGPMLLRPQKPALFVTGDSAEGAFLDALRQNGWAVRASSPLLAPSDFDRLRPVLVLLDARLPELSSLAKSLRLLPHSDDVFFVVLSDRSVSEKRRKALVQQTDVHHVISASSSDIGLCELVARLATRLRAVPALFAVVEEAEQPIEICDERNVVQFVNRAYESATGCARDDVLGTPSSDARRRSLRPPPEDARRRSSEWHCITVPTSAFSSQYVYVKRGSTDAMICRDISLKSLRSQSALVDAPISEVISMLREASVRCEEPDTQQTLREVLRMLQSSELYAPSITRFAYNDRISSGYYDGLIRLHHPSRQRKRSVVDALREKPRGTATEPRRRVSADVKNALENESSWGFNVLELERVTDHHPLVHLGTKLFDRWKVAETLQCSSEVTAKWLLMIEEHYLTGNPYHNATHAADVLQATSFFLERDRVARTVQDTHAVAALIAAAVHDLDHPGRGNSYLINTRSPLALLYNDVSVLENHHVALAFQLTFEPKLQANIFERQPREEFNQMRQAIVDMVLATDMSRHFEFLSKFQQTVFDDDCNDPDERGLNSMTVCRMLIKCADIANPTRDWSLCQKWAVRIVEEYFSQTAEELEKGLPVTMGLFDRRACNVPATQSGFIKMFARETFTLWCEFADCPRLLVHLEENFKNWERLSEHWDTSLNEKIAEVTFDAP